MRSIEQKLRRLGIDQPGGSSDRLISDGSGIFAAQSIIGEQIAGGPGGSTIPGPRIVIDAKVRDPYSPIEAVINFGGVGESANNRALIEYGAGGFLHRMTLIDNVATGLEVGWPVYNGMRIPVFGTDFRVTLIGDIITRIGAFISPGSCRPTPSAVGTFNIGAGVTTDLFASGPYPGNHVSRWTVVRAGASVPLDPFVAELQTSLGAGLQRVEVAAGAQMGWQVAHPQFNRGSDGVGAPRPIFNVTNQGPVAHRFTLLVEP
jgi:hypothetical protein